MFSAFDLHIKNEFPFLKHHKCIIAISGGVDSVVLAHLCHALKLDFALAHCNFKLRAEESDADERFIIQLAENLNVEVFTQAFDTSAYSQENKCSIQMAARELRYQWLTDLAKQLDYSYILTAHHADDDLETFLINFTRGTGLNGLTGIPKVNATIVRPLLPYSREQIEDYATTNAITWREDSSNSTRKYLRNKLRHDVVPVLKSINPHLLNSFQNTLQHLNDTNSIVNDAMTAFKKQVIVSNNNSILTYDIKVLKTLDNPKAYVFQLFNTYGFTAWADILNLLNAESGKYVVSHSHKLTKHREHLILSELGNTIDRKPIIITDAKTSETPLGTLTFKAISAIETHSNTSICIDKNSITFPLILRPWAKDDYFFPLGMQGKKKVSKYLKDEKLSPLEKENIWLLCNADDTVVWVVNHRADNRYRINSNTTNILKIELECL